MERQLPEIEIEGTRFQFDINRIALVDKKNPNNEITFEHMRDEGTHYSFEYSAIHKNYHSRNAQSFPELLRNLQSDTFGVANPPITVEIPRIGKIDPQGMCHKYGCTLQDILEKSDFEIMVNQNVYNKKLSGEPVKIDLVGKIYVIDVLNNSLRPENGKGDEIFLNEFHYDYYHGDEEVYHLFYNISENSVVDVMNDGSQNRTEDRVILKIPNLAYLDPVGANIKHGFDPKKGLLYYENLMMHYIAKPVPWHFYNIKIADQPTINQEAYILRVHKGVLPTIEIAGHTFYVDLQMDKLRPKDDFISKGIVFSDIERYYDEDKKTYTIPYNPSTREFQKPDYQNIKEPPKDLIAVRFPHERLLDRIGWNRKYGIEITHGLNKRDFKSHFTANNVPWERTFLAEVIKQNSKLDRKSNNDIKHSIQRTQNKSKGRRM